MAINKVFRSTQISLADLPLDMRVVFRRNQIYFQLTNDEGFSVDNDYLLEEILSFMEDNVTGLWVYERAEDNYYEAVAKVTMSFEHREDLELFVNNFLTVKKLST